MILCQEVWKIINIDCVFNDRYVVYCRTKAEAREVVDLLMKSGARMRRKRTVHDFVDITFGQCKETCYCVKDGFIGFSNKDWWVTSGYTVIELADLMEDDGNDMGSEVLLEFLTSLSNI